MKHVLMLAAILCTVGLMAGDTVLKTWDFSQKRQISLYNIKGITTKTSVEKGAYQVEVLKNIDKKGAYNIQLWCQYDKLKAGVNYRVDFTVKASKNATIYSTVMLAKKPWNSIIMKTLKLTAGQANQVSLAFSLKKDANAIYRTPCFLLGKAESGTVFEISDVKLVEVK